MKAAGFWTRGHWTADDPEGVTWALLITDNASGTWYALARLNRGNIECTDVRCQGVITTYTIGQEGTGEDAGSHA
jgi:hypothetical protein